MNTAIRCVLLLGALAISQPQFATADQPPEKHSFSKESWTVTDGYCAGNCPDGVMAYLKTLVGSKVSLSSIHLHAPFLDHCDGETHVEFSWTAASKLAEELEQGAPPRRHLTARSLRLPNDRAILRADAYCRSGATDLPFARFLSVETGRLQLLFEEQSILELR